MKEGPAVPLGVDFIAAVLIFIIGKWVEVIITGDKIVVHPR